MPIKILVNHLEDTTGQLVLSVDHWMNNDPWVIIKAGQRGVYLKTDPYRFNDSADNLLRQGENAGVLDCRIETLELLRNPKMDKRLIPIIPAGVEL